MSLMFRRGIAAVLLFLLCVPFLSAREWHAIDGVLEGDLIKVQVQQGGEFVLLRDRSDGYLHKVSLSRLEKTDQDFVSEFKEGKVKSNGEAVAKRGTFDRESAEGVPPDGKQYNKPEKYAILVGVNKYEKLPWAELRFCEKDAESLGEVLSQNGFFPENVFVLTNKEGNLPPTKKNIEHQIETLLPFLSSEDTVIVVFCGHGVSMEKNGYFCPSDISPLTTKDTPETFSSHLISRQWVYDKLKESNAGHKLFVVDACRDDPFKDPSVLSDRSALGGITRSLDDQLTDDVRPSSLYMIQSCEQGKKSIEDAALGHGVFSYYFIRGLQGYADIDVNGNRDRKVTTDEAFDYAKSKTKARTEAEYTDAQIPRDYREPNDAYIFEISLVPSNLPPLAPDVPAEPADPDGLSKQARAEAEQSYLDAVNYRDAGDYPNALKAIEPACRILPKKYDPERQTIRRLYIKELLVSGQSALLKGKKPEAVKIADQVLSLDPNNTEALELKRLSEVDAGESDYQAALSYRDQRDYAQALSSIESACRKSPSNETYKSERANIRRLSDMSAISELLKTGDSALSNGDYAKVWESARKVLSLDPHNERAQVLRNGVLESLLSSADTAYSGGDKAEARRLATQVLSYDSGNKRAQDLLELINRQPAAGDLKTLTVKGVAYNFRWCPPGEFEMGSPKSEEGRYDDESLHHVKLSKGFWLLESEVTQGMWESVMGTTVTEQRDKANKDWPLRGVGANNPMYYVNWKESVEFCKKLSSLSGEAIRLPTESEWEYACRAGTSTPFSFGSVLNGDKANCNGNYPYGTETGGKYLEKTIPVKSYLPNAWNLYDMHGNVWEWCSDWKGDYPSGTVTDPTGPENPEAGSIRVNRGGSWFSSAGDCRSAIRDGDGPSDRGADLGFRPLLVPR